MKIYSYKKGSISYEKNLIQALDIDLEKDKIITLVTCSYEYTGARTILVAKLKNITER